MIEWLPSSSRTDFSSKGLRDGIELDFEMICFEEKVFPVLVAVKGDPLHRAFGERNLFCGVTGEIEASDKRMFETGPMEV